MKDRCGRNMTEDAAINLNLNMIECGKCSHEFCNKCQTTPYHIGFTCEQYKEYKRNIKCRVCLKAFKKKQTISEAEAFYDICNNNVCMKYIEKACPNINKPCLHPCNGA